MKFNKWTMGLAALGVVGLNSAVQADEKASSVMTAVSATTLSGYVDTSAQWNFADGNSHNPGYAYNNGSKANGFNLNVVGLRLEKVADAADQWGAGYKVDTLFGPDAVNYSHVVGAANSQFAVKQAYVDLKAPVGNGLDIKMGVVDNPNRFEVFESGNNPNFTRSYGYGIEATTLTGLIATYQFAESLSASAGVADSVSANINSFGKPANEATSYKSYLGNVTITVPKDMGFASGSTIYGGILNGGGNASPSPYGVNSQETSFYAGVSLNTPVKELKVGATYDYKAVGNTALSKSGYQNATGVYGNYQVSEKFSLNFRGEYFSQSGYLARGFDTAAQFAGAGVVLPKSAIEGTVTAEYDLWKNVISRVEFRWDHNTSSINNVNNVGFGPNGSEKNAFELIGNVVYKF